MSIYFEMCLISIVSLLITLKTGEFENTTCPLVYRSNVYETHGRSPKLKGPFKPFFFKSCQQFFLSFSFPLATKKLHAYGIKYPEQLFEATNQGIFA